MKKLLTLSMIVSLFCLFSCNETCTHKDGASSSTTNEYEFVGGYPTEATIEKAYEQIDVQRATQVYIDFMSLASQNSIFESTIHDYGQTKAGDVGIFTEPGKGKAEAIGLTYNTESIYSTAYTDLKADGCNSLE